MLRGNDISVETVAAFTETIEKGTFKDLCELPAFY